MGIIEELLDAQIISMGEVSGIITGQVKENWDEEHPGMVMVEYFLGEPGKNQTDWVPVMSPYAGDQYGYYALPEVGTEVVLAFLMGNRNCPIVLGCIWNQENPLPENTANENNSMKKMITKGGCVIQLSEEKDEEEILIQSPSGLSIHLKDGDKTIKINDSEEKNGVTVDIENGTLTLLAEKSLELKVGDDVMLSMGGNPKAVSITGQKVTCNADQALELKGQTAKLEGTSTEIKGQGTLKLEADGTAQLKGAMVQLN
ncbi:MAG: phage baseplate assembly protein V [Lachnospiraceae bacterium]|nr:phage baseplate assembly protein V [Lachnospiraceae bacterium]